MYLSQQKVIIQKALQEAPKIKYLNQTAFTNSHSHRLTEEQSWCFPSPSKSSPNHIKTSDLWKSQAHFQKQANRGKPAIEGTFDSSRQACAACAQIWLSKASSTAMILALPHRLRASSARLRSPALSWWKQRAATASGSVTAYGQRHSITAEDSGIASFSDPQNVDANYIKLQGRCPSLIPIMSKRLGAIGSYHDEN